jgi:hypothetical protein
MIELLSQGVIALTTWVWLETHSTSVALLVATLLALTVLSVVAAALLATVLRRRAAASLPEAVHEPPYAPAILPPEPHRPVGGRGPRAPGAAPARLAPR